MDTEGGDGGVWQRCGGYNRRHRRPDQGSGGDGERETGEGERGERRGSLISLTVVSIIVNHNHVGAKILGVFSLVKCCMSSGWLHHQLEINNKDYE
jgi:hypothetical protein